MRARHERSQERRSRDTWIPACAGMTGAGRTRRSPGHRSPVSTTGRHCPVRRTSFMRFARPPGVRKYTHGAPGYAGVSPASIRGGLAIPFAGGTQAFPGTPPLPSDRAGSTRASRARGANVLLPEPARRGRAGGRAARPGIGYPPSVPRHQPGRPRSRSRGRGWGRAAARQGCGALRGAGRRPRTGPCSQAFPAADRPPPSPPRSLPPLSRSSGAARRGRGGRR